MQIKLISAAAAAALLGFSACAALRPAPDLTSRTAADASHADRAMAAAVAAGDVEAFLGHVATDAIFFGSRGPSAGRAAVALSWAPFFAPGGPRLAWDPDRGVASPSGDLAFTFGRWLLTPPAGEQPATGGYLTAWRRDADGLLRVALDGGADPLPPLPASVTRRSLRTAGSADGRLVAEAGLLLDGPREAGWYLRLSRRGEAGLVPLAEGGVFRPAER